MLRRFLRDPLGQSLLEFALVMPVFMLLVIGLMEFALVENSRNTVNFAARDASILAAEGGKLPGTDCVAVQSVETNLLAPARNIQIQYVDIYWSDVNGEQVGSAYQRYTRGGTTTCTYRDGSQVTIPYTLTSAGYPESDRCDVLAGCGGGHPTVDTVGVRVVYEHLWITAFPRITGSRSVILSSNTATRMEPTL